MPCWFFSPRLTGKNWSSRLTGRGTEPPDVIERRLAAARVELAAEDEFDLTLINTSVRDVCRQLVTLAMALVAP